MAAREFCASQRQLCLAAYAQRLCAPSDRGASGGEVIFEEYYPLDQIDFSSHGQPRHLQQGGRGLQHRDSPAVRSFFKQLSEAGFLKKNGGRLSCVYYDENTLSIQSAGGNRRTCQLAWIISRRLVPEDPSAPKIQASYDKQFPGTFLFAAGSAATGTYRGLKLGKRR